MKKKLLAVAMTGIAVYTFTGEASAEQPVAAEYRQIFQAAEFFVEYSDDYYTRVIAQKDGKRYTRQNYRSNGWGGLFGGSGSNNKFPDAMYADGKYYQFTAKNKAFVCAKSNLTNENLDPRQGWNTVEQKLALPFELMVFYWNDPFRDKTMDITEPTATWSGKKTVDKTEYECDRYASRLYNASSGEAWYVYELLYEKGNLKRIYSYVKKGEREYPINKLEIKKIGSKWPENLFKIESDTKIYAAGTGDMNDLLEQPVEVGAMEAL